MFNVRISSSGCRREELEISVRVAGGAAESNSSFLSFLLFIV